MSMKIVITDVGLAEVVNAEQSGTAPVTLSHIAFGTGQYTATKDMTALKSEFKRFNAISGGAIGDNVIHLEFIDSSADTYTVNEVGVFTESGTLFAVYSQTTPIIQKASISDAMLAFDFVLTDINTASVTVGDTNFVLNPATTETQGTVELATEAEAKAGTDTTRAITPKTLDATIEAHDNIVHRTGKENIYGDKTFSNTITHNGDVNFTSNVITDLTKESTSDELWYGDRLVDSNGVQGAIYQYYRKANGDAEINIQVRAKSSNAFSALALTQTKDGTSYATAPTPATGDNSTKIATTNWVNNKANNYLPLAGGKMTGEIKVECDVITAGSTDDRAYHFNGGKTWTTGSYLVLTGQDSPRIGRFILGASGGESAPFLLGDPDGTLTWNNKNITLEGDCLPLAGGKMTTTKAMTRDVNNSFLGLQGGTGENNDGAQLYLCGANHSTNPSSFQLHARNGETDKILEGKLDGTLTWTDKYVLNNSFQMPTDGGAVMVTAGTSSTGGAYFRLYGKNHSSGVGTFSLAATDGTNTKALIGKPDGTLTWNGKNIAVGDTTPTGSVLPFAGSTAPSGFLICDGSAISRTTYADLFKVIGTTYGAGNGSTTFNLPNYSSARMVTSSTVSVKGDGNYLGLSRPTNRSEAGYIHSLSKTYDFGYNVNGTGTTNSGELGVSTDPTKSGITGTASLASSCKFIIKY